MAKKITAPKTYEPGKGRPKEHLAYLNQREMAYLRGINGNNMEYGPRGLPSFPPPDAIGSSSKASSSSSSTSKSSASASTGSGGQRGAGSNTGPGSGRPGGPSGGTSSNLGGGGQGSTQRGAGSNTGPGSGRPGSPSGSKGPSSPMGGQGPSFSSPKSASAYNSDKVAQQKAQVNDAKSAISRSVAVRNDLAIGGIRTLNVGPMGTPVNVGRQISAGMSFTGPPKTGTIAGSIQQAASVARTSIPGMTYGNPIANPSSISGFTYDGTPQTTFSGPDYAGMLEQATSPYTVGPQAFTEAITATPLNSDYYQNYANRTTNLGIANTIEALNAGAPVGSVPKYTDRVAPINNVSSLPTSARSIGPVTSTQPYNMASPDIEHVLSVENYPDATATARPDDIEVVGGLGIMGINKPTATRSLSGGRLSTDVRNLGYIGAGSAVPQSESSIQAGAPINAPSGALNSANMSPVEQMPAYPEDSIFMKGIKHAGILGQAVRLASWNDRRNFDKMTPEQQAATMDRWAQQRDALRRNQSNVNDRGAEPPRYRPPQPVPNYAKGPGQFNESRPAIYDSWDSGVNIPSPSDSDYTLYLKYLDEKAASDTGTT